MRNFRLTIEYDGTSYNGWQVQSRTQRKKGGKVKTIQGVLEGALFKIFKKKTRLISCGRTDSGVHAKAHVANFKVRTKLSPLKIKKALNSLLPADIVTKKVEEAGPNFHAQYNALSKTYRYSIYNGEHVPPFIRYYVYHFRQPLDVLLMKKEARVLLGKHDFRAFKTAYRNGKQVADCRRHIKKLQLLKNKGLIEIDIEADGFLYNMARNIAGTLIEVGRGKFPPGSMRKILKSRDRRAAGQTPPAKGLSLIQVKYGEKE